MEHAIKARQNLSMACVDYQKAYYSVPRDWILESLKIYGINTVIIHFLVATMAIWGMGIRDIHIQRGIFQGDSLSPLLFVIVLNPLSWLLNKECKGYAVNGMQITHLVYMTIVRLTYVVLKYYYLVL